MISETIALRNLGAPPTQRPGSEWNSAQTRRTSWPNPSCMSQPGGENS